MGVVCIRDNRYVLSCFFSVGVYGSDQKSEKGEKKAWSYVVVDRICIWNSIFAFYKLCDCLVVGKRYDDRDGI